MFCEEGFAKSSLHGCLASSLHAGFEQGWAGTHGGGEDKQGGSAKIVEGGAWRRGSKEKEIGGKDFRGWWCAQTVYTGVINYSHHLSDVGSF